MGRVKRVHTERRCCISRVADCCRRYKPFRYGDANDDFIYLCKMSAPLDALLSAIGVDYYLICILYCRQYSLKTSKAIYW